jgi:uncharacterized protein YndB with AHSA1/START domain
MQKQVDTASLLIQAPAETINQVFTTADTMKSWLHFQRVI